MDLKEEDILGEKIYNHWYYLAKGSALQKFIGTRRFPEILDVGAGSGIFSRQLLDAERCDRAVCLDLNYSEETTELYNGREIQFVNSNQGGAYELILMMDVLEHVPDDLALLKEYAANLSPGGQILITVPAFQFLWSGHDVFLEHYRRYTIKGIEAVAIEAGLSPVKSRYFFASLFPAATVIRLARRWLVERGTVAPQSDLKLYPDWLNRALVTAHDIERHTLFSFNKLFGLSVFCLCQKK